jgi:hypothetical protein
MDIRIRHIPGFVQDGKVDSSCGRIIIYGNAIIVSKSHTSDHNYLLRALASRYNVNKDEVIGNAIRLYYCKQGKFMIVNGVRKIDDDRLKDKHIDLIKNEF